MPQIKKFCQAFFRRWKKQIIIALVLGVVLALSLGSYVVIGIMHVAKQQAEKPQVEATEYPVYPHVNYGTGEQSRLIQKGEYLVKAGDCIACHTATPKAPPFSGNYAVDTPFGTIYTPNLTADDETGLGRWTEANFEKAMRHGVAKDGSYYYPAFPYPYFNRLKDDDIKAIWTYLQAVPKVHLEKKDNTMIFPFNIRLMQLGWRILFFEFNQAGPYQEDKAQTAQWNRGAYLVEGLGHCAMCHTPSYYILQEKYSLAAPRTRYAFDGAHVVGYYAPAINEEGIAKYSNQEVLQVFKADKMLGGGMVIGPMKEANHDSLMYLTDQDLLSMIVYLKSVKSEALPKPKISGDNLGEGVYQVHCATCHATGAGGAPKYGDANTWAPRLKLGEQALISNAIHGVGGMPAKGACPSCTDDEIKAAVLYLISAATGETGESHTVAPKPLRQLTLADGEKIYQARCSICHAHGFQGAPIPGDDKAWSPIIEQGFMLTYWHAMQGYHDHPPKGACTKCSSAEIKAAVKYMMQQSTHQYDYALW